jgi:hypothetical protein
MLLVYKIPPKFQLGLYWTALKKQNLKIFEADYHNNQTTKFWKKSKTKTWKLIAELKASTTKKKHKQT